MNLEEAVQETKNFVKAEAKLAGVEPAAIIGKIKDEIEAAEFIESTR